MWKLTGRGLRILGDTLREFITLNGTFLSAGLAFYAFLYCFPLLLLFITALGYVLERSDLAMEATKNFVQMLFPASERSVVDALESFAEHRHVLGLAAIVGFLLFGTFLFGAVRHVLNVVFGVGQRRPYLRGLGADVLAMLGTGGLLALAVGLATSIALLLDVVSRVPSLRSWLAPGWPLVGRGLAFLFAMALFCLLFQIAPAKRLGRRSLLAAAFAGAALLETSKWIFVWYVQEAGDFAVLYGALSGLVFFILWVYYACAIFVIAAVFGRVLERGRGAEDGGPGRAIDGRAALD